MQNPPLIYLNNAATSWPKPAQVREAIHEALSLPAFGAGRTTTSQGADYLTLAREEVSRLLNTDPPEQVVFTSNATDSLNLLIQGFLAEREPRCHVLTSRLEHNSVLRPLHEYERQGRIRLTLLPFTGDMVRVRDVEAAITAETRLMVMTHGSNVLGSVQDIRAIGRLLHDHGIFFIVDGAQTLGHIPVNMQNLPVDAYVFTGHKALFGVSGTGGFYLRDPESISPVRFGGTGTDSSTLLHPRGMPERFEAGTPNYPGLAALAAGVKYIRSVGLDSIVAKAKRQTAYIIRGLQEIPTVTRYTDRPSLPIISFNVDGIENDDVGFILARAYGIVGRTGLHCAPLVHQAIDQGRGAVRLSLSWFTTDEECRAAADAIREIAGYADPAVDTT